MRADSRRAEEVRVRYLTDAIQTATPAARLTMLLDALEFDLARADKAFAEGATIEQISDLLIHAQEIILTLRDTLDTSAWEPAGRLKALYDFLHTELVMANVEKDRQRARGVAAHVSQLAAAWREAAQRVEEPSMEVSGAR